eukprot:9849591-Alexandrium_andersonii.AAC.1
MRTRQVEYHLPRTLRRQIPRQATKAASTSSHHAVNPTSDRAEAQHPQPAPSRQPREAATAAK